MKSPTEEYRNLKRSIKKAELIIGGVDKLGCKTELQHLKLQSYVLLCHAALEQYIESIGLEVALKARSIFSDSGVITKTLVALVSARLVDDPGVKGRNKLSSDLVSNLNEF